MERRDIFCPSVTNAEGALLKFCSTVEKLEMIKCWWRNIPSYLRNKGLAFQITSHLRIYSSCEKRGLVWGEFYLKALQSCWIIAEDIWGFNHVWASHVCDLWSKNARENRGFLGECGGGDAGGGRAFWPEANPFAGRVNLGGESKRVMLSHARVTTREMPLSEAFNPPTCTSGTALLPAAGDRLY